MSTGPVAGIVPPDESGQVGDEVTLTSYARGYVSRVRGGEMGSLPALIGLIALLIFFSIAHNGFMSLANMGNLVTQAAPIILLAMGLVFVLLLGEIDLSAGTCAGVCAASMAVLMVRHGWYWWLATLFAIFLGTVIGFVNGFLRAKVQIPSFVVTLALFLGLQGVTLVLIGSKGSVSLPSQAAKPIISIEGYNNDFMPAWLSWTLAAVIAIGYGAEKLWAAARRRQAGLIGEPTSVVAAKVVMISAASALFVSVFSQNRAIVKSAFFSNLKIEGVPYVVLLVAVLVVFWTLVLNRTRYGRYIYAVGGNAEAARRAGIRVDRIRLSAFVICSGMAAVSGIVLASRLESVPSNAGAGTELLLAVGAAVIGGTSLFGGRGRILDAVIGGLVVAVIQNGMTALITGTNSSAWQYIVTGIVLLLAAGFDAISRRVSSTGG